MIWLLRRLPLLIAVALLIVLVAMVPAFQRPRYWLSLAPLYFAIAALALALTPVVITGGIDLSVGSTTVLSSIAIGFFFREAQLPLGVALAGGVVVGLVCGIGNGILVNLGVPALVATLATRELYRGLAWAVSGDDPVTRFPSVLLETWTSAPLGLPLALWALLLLAIVSYLLVHHTWMGRALFAMGDNESAARFAALPVRRLQLGLYAWCGFISGLCGVGLIMKFGAAKADAERSLELLAITCVVMGGIRVTGGEGHVGGTLLGIVTVCALQAGLGRIDATWRETVTGLVLLGVALTGEAGARKVSSLQGSQR